jgi:hypothetical protein
MVKNKISEEEKNFIIKILNKNLKNSILWIPVFLFFLFPFHIIMFWLFIDIDENSSYYFFILILLFILILFFSTLDWKMKVKNGKIYRIEDSFTVISKDIRDRSDSSGSSISLYYYLYLKSNNEERKIEIESYDYSEIPVNSKITIEYYDIVNIPIKATYKENEIKIISLYRRK